MNAYFDTAIIVKLYVQEANSGDAVRLVSEWEPPYLLMPLQAIEAETAIRLKVFRREITATEMQASLDAFREDRRSHRWRGVAYREIRVWDLAGKLSARHAASLGCRTLDIVYVATALVSDFNIRVVRRKAKGISPAGRIGSEALTQNQT